MKNQAKLRKVNKLNRNTKGQALVESAAAMLVVSIFFVALAAFAVNTFSYMVYGSKIQVIANAVARQVSNRTYWLGALRPQFQRSGKGLESQKEKANEYAKKLGEIYGLPVTPIVTFPDAPDESVEGVAFTPVTVSMAEIPLPFQFSKLFPQFLSVSATGIASEQVDAPPGFIRMGFKLIDPSTSNPAVTDATQVVILPAYGFQTDFGGVQNLGGTQNNNDVVGNQPDAAQCLWAGVNGQLRSNAPYISGPDKQQILSFN
ncbi:MAG: hypothetical protein K2X27_26870 [Candidatus Obscuribacterales bacterium]|nr:hypothetical protein [Candidatus Obscuribacterales bacterium]